MHIVGMNSEEHPTIQGIVPEKNPTAENKGVPKNSYRQVNTRLFPEGAGTR